MAKGAKATAQYYRDMVIGGGGVCANRVNIAVVGASGAGKTTAITKGLKRACVLHSGRMSMMTSPLPSVIHSCCYGVEDCCWNCVVLHRCWEVGSR